ncbi:MAG: type II toxin-antitoxin system VapB family antitoxin [Deltaproteobacteria bacterium]|nr:type II toxin-antitoxin system VapB family antitoxin [Deltaproteobacteria bacterium]MCZ6562929.1 type II toxin-antitoxin system VapB family antitoxin [Deltaproteobacteria bacterium]MCZ6620574.1 type II toxin-antitoxin system VapB family antitoxin [Deltaproteobacteria bacterium]
MRTNIVLDDKLVREALKYTKVKTKRHLVDQALREFVEHHRRLDVRELRGKVRIRRGYDYKKLRIGVG